MGVLFTGYNGMPYIICRLTVVPGKRPYFHDPSGSKWCIITNKYDLKKDDGNDAEFFQWNPYTNGARAVKFVRQRASSAVSNRVHGKCKLCSGLGGTPVAGVFVQCIFCHGSGKC